MVQPKRTDDGLIEEPDPPVPDPAGPDDPPVPDAGDPGDPPVPDPGDPPGDPPIGQNL